MTEDILTLLQTPRDRKVMFANITYRTKETGELSKYVGNLGVSVSNTYKNDIEELRNIVDVSEGIEKEVATELLKSRIQSLEKGIGNNDEYTLKDTYLPTVIEGVFIHKTTGEIYLRVFVNSKTVIEKGSERKKVNSSERTIIKNKIRHVLKSHKIRTFKIERINRIAFNGDVLEVESN